MQPQPIIYKFVGTFGGEFLSGLTHSDVEVALIEEATRAQRLCKRWQEERQYRITASKFGLAVKRRRNHTSLAKQLLYPQVSGTVMALLWGQQHESDALESYRTTLANGYTLNEAGIFICDCGYLGASPDGVVKDCNNKPTRLVEVKCPYKARNKSVEELYTDPSFCICVDENRKPQLKTNHDYFFQVQGQMAVTGIHTCDFVVWTPIDNLIITLTFNEN